MTESELDGLLGEVSGPCTCENMTKMFAEKMAGEGNDPDDLIVQAFKAYDNEGKIDSKMFEHALKTWGDKMTKAEIEDIFGEFEIDEDYMIKTKDVISLFVAVKEEPSADLWDLKVSSSLTTFPILERSRLLVLCLCRIASESMTERGHFDSSNIQERMHELSNYFERFRSEMGAQKQRLLDQKAVIEFIHEADEVNEWINTQMAVAASEDYGKDVSHVEMLIKTFDSFMQTITSSEERIARVSELSAKLIKDKNS